MDRPILVFCLLIVALCLAVEASPSKRCAHNSEGPTSTHSPCSNHRNPVTTPSSPETIGPVTTSTTPATIGLVTTSSNPTSIGPVTTPSSGTIGLTSECGISSGNRPLKRVVGGDTTNPHKWPSICRLAPPACAGTLIKNQTGHFYIITAAHCTEDEPDQKMYTARCGVHNLLGDSPSHEQVLEVTKIIDHEHYLNIGRRMGHYKELIQHDISILELKTQPIETDFVNAACLPSVEVSAGVAGFVAGWGRTSDSMRPKYLQDLAKPIVSNKACEAVFNNAPLYNGTFEFDLDCERDGMFCAGHKSSGKGSCYGDSGGPLYTKRGRRWTLAGVVSFGMPPCAQEHFFDGYTDVYHHLKWITSKINHK